MFEKKIEKLQEALRRADCVMIGAGAGLSVSAGFVYTGERFREYFSDFEEKYNISDMYSGGFYPFGTLEEYWAYWSRYIYINRYLDAPKPVYDRLFELVRDREYFVLTTNVDHCFHKAGFDERRMFCTQGDFGLFQCSVPCHDALYGNESAVRRMVESQGYVIAGDGALSLPDGVSPAMSVASGLIPLCPKCGRPMAMNLRTDDAFVEDEEWRAAAKRYTEFISARKNAKTLFLELGVGYNTPMIIRYPFQRMTAQNPKAVYACINYGEAYAPDEIRKQSVCINGDIGEILERLEISRGR